MGRQKNRRKKEHVTGQAFLSVDELPASGKCKVLVQLQVEQGWHIHANPPGDEEIDIATELELDSDLDPEIELGEVASPPEKKCRARRAGNRKFTTSAKWTSLAKSKFRLKRLGKKNTLTLSVTYQPATNALPAAA